MATKKRKRIPEGPLAKALRSKIGKLCHFTDPRNGEVVEGFYGRGRKVTRTVGMSSVEDGVSEDGNKTRTYNFDAQVFTVPKSIKITFGPAPVAVKKAAALTAGGESEPHVVGTVPPDDENDPAGRMHALTERDLEPRHPEEQGAQEAEPSNGPRITITLTPSADNCIRFADALHGAAFLLTDLAKQALQKGDHEQLKGTHHVIREDNEDEEVVGDLLIANTP